VVVSVTALLDFYVASYTYIIKLQTPAEQPIVGDIFHNLFLYKLETRTFKVRHPDYIGVDTDF